MRIGALVLGLMITLPSSAIADSFQRVEDETGFMSLVKDRDLKRLGIRLNVMDDGRIEGRAFGRKVTGKWSWDSGYFCRDLAVNGDPLEYNCQMVQVKGETLRFTSDKGTGQYADLRLD